MIFQFQGLTMKTAMPSNFYWRLAKQWTDADPEHRKTTTAAFWFEHGDGVESYVLEDAVGPILFFKLVRHDTAEIEIHIQFPPFEKNPRMEQARRERIATGMTCGLEWIEKVLAYKDVSTLFFVSESSQLIKFCEKRLGFVKAGTRFTKTIARGRPNASAQSSGN